MDATVNTVTDKIKKLRTEDVVVERGGANDTSKNNTKVDIKHFQISLFHSPFFQFIK